LNLHYFYQNLGGIEIGTNFAETVDGEAITMTPPDRLDLVGVGWPICLLTYQQRAQRLAPGALIEVSIEDPDVAATIRQLARRQQDRIVDEQQDGRVVRLLIQKQSDCSPPRAHLKPAKTGKREPGRSPQAHAKSPTKEIP
jgi:TusA-related sulfurtransferase